MHKNLYWYIFFFVRSIFHLLYYFKPKFEKFQSDINCSVERSVEYYPRILPGEREIQPKHFQPLVMSRKEFNFLGLGYYKTLLRYYLLYVVIWTIKWNPTIRQERSIIYLFIPPFLSFPIFTSFDKLYRPIY